MTKTKAWGIAGFILGILGILLILVPYFGMILSVLAIVFYALQRKNKPTGLGTTALILGIIGAALNLIMILAIVGLIFSGGFDTVEGEAETAAIEESGTPGYLTYSNRADGFIIGYPAEWDISEDYMGTDVIFMSPMETKSDPFLENVNVIVEDISSNPMGLDEYTELSLENLAMFFNDYRLSSSEDALLSGYPAKVVVYTGTQGKLDMKWSQVYSIVDDNVYVLTLTTQKESYGRYVDTFADMLSTFEFITDSI